MCRWSGRIDQPFAKVRPTDWQPPIEWVVGEMTIKDANLLLISWIKERPDETANQKAALEQYGKLFHPDNLPNLTEEEFRGFLTFKNNRHWGHIQRHSEIYEQMDRLRECLKILLDEDLPIDKRLDTIVPVKGPAFIKGLNRAVLTPILMCVYPHKYAVYNRVSEGSLMGLGMLKARPQGSFGTRYVQINEGCHQIANEINQPLYLVDTMLAKVFSLLPKDEEEEAAMARFGYEGRIKLRIHRDRERRPQLAKAKKADALKKYGKLACDVCTFVFEARYGEHGSKFIECHHIQPLSEIQETDGTKVTLEELALVCSNCHRMLHWGDWPPMDELRSRLISQN